VWRLIFNGDFGVLNQVLARFGVDGPHWVSTPGYALVAVSIVGLWASLGLAVIILGAGLRSIPTELYEAAQLDGAGGWRILRSVTVPLLTPSIFFVTVITFINAFQLFDLLFALLGQENPAMPVTQSLVLKFYNVGIVAGDRGYAAAIAVLILLIIGATTALQFRMQRRWVHYG
jgi:multiple sugar transport system permease protein